ncbi:hypothetical protein SAY86_022384 [Trapa natans]|uniref:Uncharacterized protein n=1 Tax=Trapa natans TaxID=22666 RepID=A0AAN7LU89_TRANT|nr:hypothetical protein SAY86_022384 [Trapa natans]
MMILHELLQKLPLKNITFCIDSVQVYLRDFVPGALAFLMNGEPETVNFTPSRMREKEGKECMERIVKRLHALSDDMRRYFWLHFQQLNDIYRYKAEEYSHTAVNKF